VFRSVQVPEGSEEEAHGAHQEAAQSGGCLIYFFALSLTLNCVARLA
jgi:hypothetical protein